MILRRVLLTALLLSCLLLYARTVSSYILSNMGLLNILDPTQRTRTSNTNSLNHLEALFQRAATLRPNNPGAHRGLGFVYWYTGSDLQALNEWSQIGLNASDYIRFGQHANNTSESLRWYNLAERLKPASPELWLHVGRICQSDPSVGDVCKRFLAHNDYNWLVDTEFAFDREAWHFNRREGAKYAITKCPGIPEKNCAMVEIYEVTSPHGTSWVQCLTLEPGETYRLSAWIKVETEGEWIPLYYQGDRNGDPHGINLGGSHIGAQDWTYFDKEFVAPEFDDHRACFHPLRLLDLGSAWFHSVKLRSLEQ